MKKSYWLVFLLTLFCTSSVALADTTSVLLIPVWSTTAAEIYGFDPFDGHNLGVFTALPTLVHHFNAIQGPDGNIYVAEYGDEKIHVFDATGNYLYIYADGSDGLDFVRGIAFREDHLFIPNGTEVFEFDGPHSRLSDFITNPDGEPMHEIFFLEDGRSLVSVAGANIIRLYNSDGTPSADVISVPTMPQQIQADPQLPGAYLTAGFALSGQIMDFDLDGTIHNMLFNHYGGGIYRLGNGNLLVTDASGSTGGVYEITNAGDTVEVELEGMRAYWIELCEVELGGPTCAHLPGDSDENGIARELTDVVKMIAYYRGFDQPVYVCDCSEQNPEYKPSADVDGNCTSFELTDVVKSIAAYRGPVPLTGCEDCPGIG